MEHLEPRRKGVRYSLSAKQVHSHPIIEKLQEDLRNDWDYWKQQTISVHGVSLLERLGNKTKSLKEIVLYTQTTLASNLLRKLLSALMHVIGMNEVSDKNSNRRSDRRTEFNLCEPLFLVFADPSGASIARFLKGLI